jgi:hypothetical protein
MEWFEGQQVVHPHVVQLHGTTVIAIGPRACSSGLINLSFVQTSGSSQFRQARRSATQRCQACRMQHLDEQLAACRRERRMQQLDEQLATSRRELESKDVEMLRWLG